MAIEVNSPKEVWASGEAYERYVGRWSRLVAREFIQWLDVPARSRWLDVGSGTGGLSQTILQLADPQSIKGIDRSPEFVTHARAKISDPRVAFEVGDAQALPEDPGTYDAVVSGLVLNFVPQAEVAIREMERVLRPGGVGAVYVWDYAGEMQFMRVFWETASAMDATAARHNEGSRFPLCKPEPLKDLFVKAGLGDAEVRAIDIPTVFRDFEDYWTPFLGGTGPAPTFVMSLNEDGRTALRERLRSALPAAADGSIALIARAWAVRGIK